MWKLITRERNKTLQHEIQVSPMNSWKLYGNDGCQDKKCFSSLKDNYSIRHHPLLFTKSIYGIL